MQLVPVFQMSSGRESGNLESSDPDVAHVPSGAVSIFFRYKASPSLVAVLRDHSFGAPRSCGAGYRRPVQQRLCLACMQDMQSVHPSAMTRRRRYAPLIDDPDVDSGTLETVGGEEAGGASADDEHVDFALGEGHNGR